jgi:hypothetical protein
MPILVAFMVVGLALLLLIRYERQKDLKVKSSETDLQAMNQGAAYGGFVGQAHMNQLGIEPDSIVQREEAEFKKFKFD